MPSNVWGATVAMQVHSGVGNSTASTALAVPLYLPTMMLQLLIKVKILNCLDDIGKCLLSAVSLPF